MENISVAIVAVFQPKCRGRNVGMSGLRKERGKEFLLGGINSQPKVPQVAPYLIEFLGTRQVLNVDVVTTIVDWQAVSAVGPQS